MTHLVESSMRCRVCEEPVPKCFLEKEYWVCKTHNTKLLNLCRKKSWKSKWDFEDKDMKHFAQKGTEAFKER
jgi:hypothetical protein